MNTAPLSRPALPADYHTHTPLCKHASGSVAEFRQAGERRGLAELCFTDHSPEPSGYDAKHRMQVEQMPTYRTMVEELQGTPGLPVFLGMEADFFPGCEPFLGPFLAAQPLDLVLGSVHYIRDWGFDNPDYIKTWESVDVKGVWREYFALLHQLVDTRMFDVIGHFDLPKKFGHRLGDHAMKEMVQPLLDHIAKRGMGLEINTSGWRREVKEAYPSPLILSLAAERGIALTFGSDAHAPEEVGYGFEQALDLARETGFTQATRFRRRQGTGVALA